MGRSPSSSMQGLKKGCWTEEEDRKLFNFIRENGEKDWHSLPQRAGLSRCGKSCRLRWANYLRPGIRRGDFSPEEEETIIRLQASIGNRWATIARHLYRRTDNEIKNYWNTRLKRRVAKSNSTDNYPKVSTEDNIIIAENKCATSSATSLNCDDKMAILGCPNHSVKTSNASTPILAKSSEITKTSSCVSPSNSNSTSTNNVPEFDNQSNSGSNTVSGSARITLNKIASNTRLVDLRQLLINGRVDSMANNQTQTMVTQSNTNNTEAMFKRRMDLWLSFDEEKFDLEEFFFGKGSSS